MKVKKFIFLVRLFALFCAHAAELQFYPQAREIPSLSFSAIAQDPRGFLWFGTYGSGLVRYAGGVRGVYGYVPFDAQTPASSQILCLFMDGGTLWAGTNAGVTRFDTASGSLRNYSVGGMITRSIVKDSAGRIWAASSSSLNVLENDGYFKSVPFAGEALYLYHSAPTDLLVCSSAGLFTYASGGETESGFYRPDFVKAASPLAGGRITAFCTDADGNYWAAVQHLGLVKTDPRTGNFSVYALPDKRVTCLKSFGEKLVLAGTAGGLLIAVDTADGAASLQAFGEGNGAAAAVSSLFEDENGLLWAATAGSGLYVFDRLRSYFTELNAAPYASMPVASLVNSGNFLWAGLGGGIARLNAAGGVLAEYTPANGRLPAAVTLVYESARGAVYAGTNEGLFLYEKAKDCFLPVRWYEPFARDAAPRQITAVYDGGGAIWVGSRGGGIVKHDPLTGRTEVFTAGLDESQILSNNYVNFIAADSFGRIWAGTNYGLNCWDEKNNTFAVYYYSPEHTEGLPHNAVTCFYESSGTVLFGTEGGLAVFDAENALFKTCRAQNCFPAQTVRGISETASGLFLLATSDSLYEFSPATGVLYVHKNGVGLSRREFTGSPLLFQGRTCLPTSRGILLLDGSLSSRTIFAKKPPRTIITDVAVNGISAGFAVFNPDLPFIVGNGRNNVSISFTSLDFSPLASPVYTYRLEGFEAGWHIAEERERVQYASLPPGKYTFRVKTAYAAYELESDEAVFSFRVAMPFYRRWYFLGIFGAVLCALAYAAIKIRAVFTLRGRVEELEQTKNTLQTSNRKLEYLSNIDALTGVDNRRSFETLITEIWNRAVAENQRVAIIMADVDFFKSFNDKNGHVAGDGVLRSIAFTLRACLEKENGIVCRYGGEEFVTVLFGSSLEEAAQIAEHMRSGVEKLGIPSARQADGFVTASFGVYAALPADSLAWKQFVDNADQALYRAKMQGRNRVCVFE